MAEIEPDRAVQKAALRKDALGRRRAIPETERIEKALKLAEFADDIEMPAGAVIAGYWPIRDELDPRPLLSVLRKRGHGLCLPVVAKPNLIFREFGTETEFEDAGFGTMAPGPTAPEVRPDVLLMPLSAFDSAGNRVGYGKGHYDTAIAALEKNGPVICIGLAFDVQEVGEVPAELHDKPLNGILTESGFRRFAMRG
ncbi:5-formyltetrahydrofolate cyclo-ligase [Roseibium sp. TrichSKD4]|uniref:5-formyltetrahydrofolate cyclo-ligase n=1 Tax=Roseibium sp. TrichSKD4 TaxID=744980 RepID=UPI0001E56D7C|nr:5-formyltetrahydrofolate cyclo-ligase [Roseibium sp. TrichSKD4]EFO31502.1 5-formyltetrahydrofolate cyclo-ligase [Roseibium sp. TrichSKD4]